MSAKLPARHIVIAGAGIAAVEALLALRALAGRSAQLTLLSPARELLYRPVTVAEPFERGEARTFGLDAIVVRPASGISSPFRPSR